MRETEKFVRKISQCNNEDCQGCRQYIEELESLIQSQIQQREETLRKIKDRCEESLKTVPRGKDCFISAMDILDIFNPQE